MRYKFITAVLLFSTIVWSIPKPLVDYRMDSCQWVGGGVTDVRDHSINALDGEAMNSIQTDRNDSIVGFSGHFTNDSNQKQHIVVDHNNILNLDQNMTITFWIKALNAEDSHILNKYNNNDNKGFKIHYKKSKEHLRLIVVTKSDRYRLNLSVSNSEWSDNQWHFVSVRYDGSRLQISFDDKNITKLADGSVQNATTKNFVLGARQNGAKAFNGYMDEFKLWNVALTDSEIEQIRTNESNQNNYDGSNRDTPVCEGNITAHSWKLIGIPADLRGANYTIDDIMGDDLNGIYGADWRLYKRQYSDTNNSAWYTYISDSNETLEFGKAYWLGSKNDESWNVNDINSVDYNASCVSGQNAQRCVKISVVPVVLSEDDGDDLNGTGPYRYNMLSFTGRVPIHWSRCRIVVNGTAYTPSQSEDHNYTSSQVWVYNPSDAKANSNGYTTFTDVDSNDWLLPYRGFYIELRPASKGKDIKLLIPQD